jgi:hypothetical protein
MFIRVPKKEIPILSSYQADEGTVRLVAWLKNAGHELLYLSNNTRERVAHLDERYSFLQKFDDGFFYHVVKHKALGWRLSRLKALLSLKQGQRSCYFCRMHPKDI